MLRQRLDAQRERFLDRAEAVRVGRAEAEYVITALRDSPAGYAGTLAEEMGISHEAALAILERFIGLALSEIGDLPRQAVRDAQRA